MDAPAVMPNLGEWCVQRGLATPEKINECLRLQRDIEASGRPVPRLGELLVQQGILTAADVARALAEQKKQIYACAACGVRVNVSLRSDAAGYRCARCQGALTPLADIPDVRVEGDDMIVVSRDPVPPEVAAASLDPSARFGKYVLLQEVGSGGVGQVFKAWDTYLSQYVALKRLRAADASEPAEAAEIRLMSLLKEARHSVRLRHPGIISVFDIGRVNREFYMSMEYIEGETLLDRIVAARRRGKPSPFYEDPKRTLNQIGEVASAVHYAHTRPSPIIHCDLKPGNILLDAQGHVHVLDFGLARSLKLDRGGDGEISGTPCYMAPEQASGKADEIDARTDVYALGAILYELLTGRPPFTGETIDVIVRTIDEQPSAPSQALHDTTRRIQKDGNLSTRQLLRIPPFLESLCMQCLRKSRFERPQTMQEFMSLIVQGLKREAQRSAVPQP